MRLSSWFHRYRWRIAIILAFPAAGLAIGFLIKVAVVAPALAAAAIAGVFAWGQWHTARKKLVLDLFDKRFERFKDVEEAYGKIYSNSDPSIEEFESYERAVERARFLFGTEVIMLMKQMQEKLRLMNQMDRDIEDPSRGLAKNERSLLIEGADARYSSVTLHFHQVEAEAAAYLRMDQKLPRPPQEWLTAFAGWLKRKWDEPPTGE